MMRLVWVPRLTVGDCSLCSELQGIRARMLSLPHALSMGLEITGMDLLSRVYVPFDSTGNKAFGMGAAEKSAYDPMNKASPH